MRGTFPAVTWVEVADRTYARRYEPWDVTVGAVIGPAGVLVIDTRASEREGRQVLDDLRRLDRRLPRWVVNTHAHFDHVNGNPALRPAEVWGHPSLTGHVPVPPDRGVREADVIDLGDRPAVLRHLGRGHTGGDVVVSVPGAVFAGDLVEESGPPAYDELSFPLDWPATALRLLSLVGAGDRVVPGHGAVVDRAFAVRQQLQLEVVARTIRDLWAASVPPEGAVDAGRDRWPFPPSGLADAVGRGYHALDQRNASAT
jgi:glyoxylase-like metal-dependent hydrolase (beta-lactamase superfamily II)